MQRRTESLIGTAELLAATAVHAATDSARAIQQRTGTYSVEYVRWPSILPPSPPPPSAPPLPPKASPALGGVAMPSAAAAGGEGGAGRCRPSWRVRATEPLAQTAPMTQRRLADVPAALSLRPSQAKPKLSAARRMPRTIDRAHNRSCQRRAWAHLSWFEILMP